MKTGQDVSIPYGDSRRIEWTIEDTTGPDAGESTNLLDKSVVFEVYPNSPGEEPTLEIDDTDARLRIDDESGGIVSCYLSDEETTLNLRTPARYYLRVVEAGGEDRWTVATGKFTIVK